MPAFSNIINYLQAGYYAGKFNEVHKYVSNFGLKFADPVLFYIFVL